MSLIAVIEDRATAEKILSHLRLPTRAPPQPALALGTRFDPHEGVELP